MQIWKWFDIMVDWRQDIYPFDDQFMISLLVAIMIMSFTHN